MRLKSDSCFSFHNNRVGSLWKKGIPNARQGSQLLDFKGLIIKDSNKQNINFSFLYVQEKYLVADQNYINLENLLFKNVIMKLSNHQNHKPCQKTMILSNNIDQIEINGPVLLVDEFFRTIKLQVIQDDFNQQYEILKLLGKGSFAKVYRVKQSNKISFLKDKKIYAAKIFNKRKMRQNKEENEMSLWKEIEIMRMLNHENIIKLHEVYEDEKKVYLILDILEGGELISNFSDTIKLYDEHLVRKLIHNILNALNYIHELQIIHRDIKPENIILRQKDDITNIVLADFGLADIYNPQGTYLFQRCGSIGYVAPELLNNKNYDFKVDIFSLGVVLFFLLTGEQAFKGSETKEVLENNLIGNIELNKLDNIQISKEAKDLCKSMLQLNPNNRISSKDALSHPWFYIDKTRIKINTLKINKKPTIIRPNRDIIHSNTPLWVNKSLKSITDSSDNLGSINRNVRDQTIQQIFDEEEILEKFQLNNSQYDLDDDYVQEDSTPYIKIQNHQLLVKQRSLP